MPFVPNLSIWNEPFDFVSSLALEQSVAELQSKNEPTSIFSFRNPLKVEVAKLDDDAYQFRLYQDTGRNLVVETVGVLERHGDSTRVSGVGRFDRLTIVGILLLLGVLAFVVKFSVAPAIGVGLGVFFVWMLIGCKRLVNRLHEILHASPNQNTSIALRTTDHSYTRTRKTLRNELLSVALVVGFVIVWTTGYLGIGNSEAAYCAIQSAVPRVIVNSSVKLKPLWTQKIPLGSGYDKPRLVIANGTLYTQNCRDITAFNLLSGKQLWVSEHTSEFGDGIEGQMTVDVKRNLIYARRSIFGMRAVSMTTGKIVWTIKDDLKKKFMPSIDLLPDGTLLADDFNGDTWQVDPTTGALQSTTAIVPYPQNYLVDGVQFSICGDCIAATDSSTGNRLWKFNGLDGADIVSNAGVLDQTVYVMDQHAKVHLLDLHTGRELGAIQFELPQNQDNLHNGPEQISDSVIVAEGNILVVSFHDTGVLTVYEIQKN